MADIPKTSEGFYRRLLGSTAIELSGEKRSSILDAQLAGLMTTFRADLGGVILRRDPELIDLAAVRQHGDDAKDTPQPAPAFQLFKLIDRKGVGFNEGLKQGDIYRHRFETPRYLQSLWEITNNHVIRPTDEVGIDLWLPIWTERSGLRGAFFIDDTSRSLNEVATYSGDLAIYSTFFSELWERLLEEQKLRQDLRRRFKAITGGLANTS